MSHADRNATEITVGCWVSTSIDGGEVVRIEPGTPYPIVFISDAHGAEARASRSECQIVPSPAEIWGTDGEGGQAAELRGDGPREGGRPKSQSSPREFGRNLTRRGSYNHFGE